MIRLKKVPNDISDKRVIDDDLFITLDGEHVFRRVQGDVIKEVSQHFDRSGYKTVNVVKKRCSKGYEQTNLSVHALVYRAIKGKIDSRLTIDHINGDKTKNNPGNLQMISRLENTQKYFHFDRFRNNFPKRKYTDEEMKGEEFFVKLPEYQLSISNKGRVKSYTDRILKGSKVGNNLVFAYKKNDGKHSTVSLGTLIIKAFFKNPPVHFRAANKNAKDVKDVMSYMIAK